MDNPSPAPASNPVLTRLGQLHAALSFHGLKPDQAVALENLRAAQKSYADYLVSLTPAGREQSLAITEFESSCMWATKAIVLHGS